MALARDIGLEVPRTFIHQHGATRVLVIRRYDRAATADGTKRLHQEDFCQALRILPDYKYEAEGGPSLAACFELVRNASIRSGKDALSLLNWVIFNYLIGNSDAHGKNISLVLLPEGPMLAPFYDLLSTRIYAHYGLAEGLAMKIGGESEPDAIRATPLGTVRGRGRHKAAAGVDPGRRTCPENTGRKIAPLQRSLRPVQLRCPVSFDGIYQ